MKRRSFFSRAVGAIAGVFGVGAASGACGGSIEYPHPAYAFRAVACDVVEPTEDQLSGISGLYSWMLGYETGILQQHLCRTEGAFRMMVHPKNVERLSLICTSKGRTALRTRTIDDHTVEITVPPHIPGWCEQIFKSRGHCWDNLVRT